MYLVAIGLENGCINMYKWSSVSEESGDNWQTCLLLNNSYPFLQYFDDYVLCMHIFFSSVYHPHLYGLSSNEDCAPVF